MSAREYYLCQLLLDHRSHFFLWFRDDADGIEQDSSGMIRTFLTAEAALSYARHHALPVKEEPAAQYDFDSLASWCEEPHSLTIRCAEFLNAWNMLGDLRPEVSSIFRAADRRGTPIYDKLFFGCNLPSITPEGHCYTPSWSDHEVQDLARILRLGLNELRSRLSVAAA